MSASKRYCSVPQCNTYVSSTVSLHYFPRDEKLKKIWQQKLKIGKPVTKYMNVCRKHFTEEDFKTREGCGKPKLKRWAVPSRNIPVGTHDIKQSRPRERMKSRNVSKLANCVLEEQPDQINNLELLTEEPLLNIIRDEDVPMISSCAQKVCDVSTQTDEEFPYFVDTNKKLKTFTSVDFDIVEVLEKCTKNILEYNKESIDKLQLKIILVLIKLKLNLPFTCLAILFSISESSCRRSFYATLTFLAMALSPAINWPTKDEILTNMPKCFQHFKNTRVVLDCTEIPIQKCRCLKCRILSYSHYKSTHTIKILIGVTPSGFICYKSAAYGGRSSDKGIFNNENLIAKLNPYEAIMVDKGFLIDKECEDNLVTLIRPPFLRKQEQFTKEDAEKTAKIARARIHVERAIQRIKNFKITTDRVEWYMLSSFNEVMTVVTALVNLSTPILSEEQF